MSTSLIIALVTPWIFWGILAGLLIYAQRSWINVMFIPVLITLLLLLIAGLSSDEGAFWLSVLLHLFLAIYFIGSYISFVFRETKNKN
jgi:hypothetical protein